MLTPKKAVISLLLLLLTGLVFFALYEPPEPTYKGRPLSHWVEKCGQIYTAGSFEEGSEGVRAIGTNAIPYLVKWIGGEASMRTKVRATFRKTLAFLHLPQGSDSEIFRAVRAAGARNALILGALEGDTKLAVPHLARLLVETENPDCAWTVAKMLASLLPEGAPGLVAAATNKHVYVRFAVADALHSDNQGTNFNSVLPLLEKLARDPDKEVAGRARSNLPFKPSPGK